MTVCYVKEKVGNLLSENTVMEYNTTYEGKTMDNIVSKDGTGSEWFTDEELELWQCQKWKEVQAVHQDNYTT